MRPRVHLQLGTVPLRDCSCRDAADVAVWRRLAEHEADAQEHRDRVVVECEAARAAFDDRRQPVRHAQLAGALQHEQRVQAEAAAFDAQPLAIPVPAGPDAVILCAIAAACQAVAE